ncbi:plasmid mobilization protein, partial [Salmonella enterica subsp. enterica serovar Infantis]
SPRHTCKEHSVSDNRERCGCDKRQKTLIRAVGFSPDEYEIIIKKAEDATLTVSDYIRIAA